MSNIINIGTIGTIIIIVFTIFKILLLLGDFSMKKNDRYHNGKMKILRAYRKNLTKKQYKRLKREAYFFKVYGIRLSDKSIAHIIRKKDNELLDSLKKLIYKLVEKDLNGRKQLTYTCFDKCVKYACIPIILFSLIFFIILLNNANELTYMTYRHGLIILAICFFMYLSIFYSYKMTDKVIEKFNQDA